METVKKVTNQIVRLFCKINTNSEQELSSVFGIQSIPTMLFIGADGEPMMQLGAFPKHAFKKIIEEKLLLPVKTEE